MSKINDFRMLVVTLAAMLMVAGCKSGKNQDVPGDHDVELVEMNSEGKFVKDTPGAGMLQSLNKYDLANVMIPDTEEKKREKLFDEIKQKALYWSIKTAMRFRMTAAPLISGFGWRTEASRINP